MSTCSSYSFTTTKEEPLLHRNDKLDHLVDVANKAMDTAAEIIMRHYLARGNVFKASDSNALLWTSIAAEVETAMISVIVRDSTCHAVYRKQSGWNNCSGPILPEFVWVLDPINGTTDGLLPTFGTLVAVLHNGKPVIGCINNPITRIKTIGRRNGITTRNGDPVRTRACESLGEAYVDIKEPDYNKDAKATYDRLAYKVGTTLFNGGCVAYTELAAGFLQVVIDTAVDPCSFLGLIPIVEGAGGIITDWQGNQLSWHPCPASSIPQDGFSIDWQGNQLSWHPCPASSIPQDGFSIVASADPRTHQQIISEIS